MKTHVFASSSPHQTEERAAQMAHRLPLGSVLALCGPLGAGKTVFVRGFAAACGVKGLVTSPTFTLIQQYEATPPLVHIDLYRLQSADDILDMGLDAIWGQANITLIEWAGRAAGLLPVQTIYVRLSLGDTDTARRIEVQEPT